MKSMLVAIVLFSGFAFANPIPAEKVLDAQILDFNEDGGFDRAVLVEGELGDADLHIYVSNGDVAELVFFREAFMFNGGMWGQQPELGLNEAGSLLVTSRNESIGRSRWELTLTVAQREGILKVVGITYSTRDTLDESYGGNCDINLLTGKGFRNGKVVKENVQAIALEDWNENEMPEACQFF